MKYRILRMLEGSAGEYVSGGNLSGIFKVSRTAVWKYVNELKKQGYRIDSSPKKGYRLISAPDVLNAQEVSYGLNTKLIGKRIVCFEETGSTNDQAKKIALEDREPGTVVIADRQTAGRGRLGRQWMSPQGTGIWMSVVLLPPLAPQDVQLVTLAASIAVTRAIIRVTGIRPGIKWPNDILLDGRKVCGILTEMSSEMDRVNYVVTGIGINVSQQAGDFPGELRHSAVSLKAYAKEKGMTGADYRRADLVKTLLEELEHLYEDLCSGNSADIIEEWKTYSVTLGREVRFVLKGCEYRGTAVDITGDGKLVVGCSDGIRREVLSGEVTFIKAGGV